MGIHKTINGEFVFFCVFYILTTCEKNHLKESDSQERILFIGKA